MSRVGTCLVTLAAVMLLSFPVEAHHPSGVSGLGSSSGTINTIGAATLDQGKSAVSLILEFISLDELSDATLEAAAADHQHVHSLSGIESLSISYAYGFTNNFILSVRLPHVSRIDIREGRHEHIHEPAREPGAGLDAGAADAHGEHTAPAVEQVENTAQNLGNADGIGDLVLLGQHRFHRGPGGLELAALGGVKTPTGETDERDRNGERFDAEFQPGSGSWDGLVGLAATQRRGAWSLDGNILYTAVSEGTQDTDLGDRFHYNFGVSYRAFGREAAEPHHHVPGAAPHAPGMSLDLVLEVNGEWHDKQEVDGDEDDNSGGTTVYLSPGLRLAAGEWSGFLSVGLPIVNDLNGIQAEPDYRLTAGLGVVF